MKEEFLTKEICPQMQKFANETRPQLQKCEICPHKCGINREDGHVGRCKSKDTIKIAKVSIHEFEEPCISGKNGSGTVFFSNCTMNCVFCQNYEISQEGKGREITIDELAEIFLEQQKKNVENINLVTPTSYVPQIVQAIKIAKEKGLNIPIVYNTNGYENVETIKSLKGYIDIYLPDLKYAENELGKKYSKVNNYFEIATEAIKEMNKQVGEAEFDENGVMKKGMLIRHLVLPNHISNSKKVLNWINKNMPKDVCVSLMAQYFPTYKAIQYEDINRRLKQDEYEEIENYLYSLEIDNGYVQDFEENADESIFVPSW